MGFLRLKDPLRGKKQEKLTDKEVEAIQKMENDPNLKTEYDKSGKLISFEAYGLKYDAVSIGKFYDLSLTYQAKKINNKDLKLILENANSIERDGKKISEKDINAEIGSVLEIINGIAALSTEEPNCIYDMVTCNPDMSKDGKKLRKVKNFGGYIHTHPEPFVVKYNGPKMPSLHSTEPDIPSPEDRNSASTDRNVIVSKRVVIVYNKNLNETITIRRNI